MVDIMQANKARRAVMRYLEKFASAFGEDDDDLGPGRKGAVPQPAPQVKKKPISLLSMLHDAVAPAPPPPPEAAAPARPPRSPRRGLGLASAASSTDDFANVGLHLSSSSLASSFVGGGGVVEGALNPLLSSSSWVQHLEEAHFGADREGGDDDWPSEGEAGLDGPLIPDDRLDDMRHKFQV